MGFRIGTNVGSLRAQRQLREHLEAAGESLEKLSSGMRINRSSDDAAGLELSESMGAKMRGIAQAKRNASDGISFLQVAEGGLSEMDHIVIRMRELTTQAASDTLGERERSLLNKEFVQLGLEAGRIQETTEYNGLAVFTQDPGNTIQIQVGAYGQSGTASAHSQTIALDFKEVRSLNQALKALGKLTIEGERGQELGRGGDTSEVFDTIDETRDRISSVRASLGSVQGRLSHTVASLEIGMENLSAAQSSIRDVDYAEETAKLAQARIQAAASTSILSQANSLPEGVLQLLH